ncbi:MAG TPA: IclR family transcriptional regulator [Anaerolineaceae bacterium]|nr:IclR family transcriptional regulator [Anaerolineaceae bacterium]
MDYLNNQEENGNDSSNSVRAVDRALDVLLCFNAQTPALNMTQISERIGIHKSTVHRLLATLERRNFVRRDPETGVYRLGYRLLQMAYLSQENIGIRQIALPYMRMLNEKYRETIDLAILDNGEALFLDVIQSPQRVKLASSMGQHLPAFSTASGKAILAWLPEEEALAVLQNTNISFTPNIVPTREAFLEDMRETRKRGYSLDCEGLETGIHAVGVPLFRSDGTPIASLAIAGPAFRMECSKIQTFGEELLVVGNELNELLKLVPNL